VWRRIFTTDNLVFLVQKVDPYPDYPELSERQKAGLITESTSTERVDPITMEPLLESNAFSVSYVNSDPQLAQAVTEQLVQMFLDYSRATRTEQATGTSEFLELRAEDARTRILELDRLLADFRGRYSSALPETRARIQQSLERTERELDAFELQILVAEERERALDLQLQQINPNLFDPAGDWRAELAAMRAELAEARQRYTENHPDVRRLTRAIEAMSARTDLEPEFAGAPDNPEYIAVASQLDTVRQQLGILRANAARSRLQIAEYESGLEIAPEVEREYSQLTRDYGFAQERLKEIEDSLAEARLAQVLETEQRGLRYSLIRPPDRPSRPSSPNRLGIILLGIVLGGAVSVGLAALRESADPTVRSARDLLEITDIAPLGAVPVILNGIDKRRRAIAWALGLATAFAGLAFVGSALS
jgi:uncharacterized protein involved in exopolysaccharide biosynthesis